MKLDFCEIHAPEALKADTVAKMRQQAERHRRPARLSRRIAVCAAAFAAVFVLVSAGTRVSVSYTHLTLPTILLV